MVQAIDLAVRLFQIILVGHGGGDLREVYLVPDLGEQLAGLLYHLVADGVLDLLVVVPSLLDLAVLPLAEPVPVGQ